VFRGDAEERAVELDPNQKEIELNFFFFADNRINNIWLRFDYSFTQNEGLAQDSVHSKSLSIVKSIRSQSPFKIEWQVISKNPFVSSLRSYLKQNIGKSDDSDFRAITGKMVTSNEEHCLLMCKLSTNSATRPVELCKINLEINPDFADFIQEIEKVDAIGEDKLLLEPGESFDCLFKLKVKKLDKEAIRKINYLFGDEEDPLQKRREGKKDDPLTSKQLTSGEVFNKWKDYYTLHEMNLFSELHFVWAPSDFQSENEREEINCCLGSPPLFILETPVRVRIRNEKEIESVVQFQPFTVEYEITNLTSRCIATILQYECAHDAKAHFLFAGEVKSLIYLMPDYTEDEENGGYIVKYTLFP